MSNMFYYCSSLEHLYISNFDTRNVIEMEYMFCAMHSIISLDLSSFNTSNVYTMKLMFKNSLQLNYVNFRVLIPVM